MPAPHGNRNGCKPEELKKSKVLPIRLTETEQENIGKLAKAEGLSKAAYVLAKIEESVGCKLITPIEIETKEIAK